MQKGMYVRCPIHKEPGDELFPRSFVMAQITEVNNFAETVKVRIHDLHRCKAYYEDAFAQTVFDRLQVRRCLAPIGFRVKTKHGWGRVAALIPNTDLDALYDYYVDLEGDQCQAFSEADLQIDFNQMDYNPLQQFEDYEFQNPSWYCSRLIVSNTNHVLNNAVYGFKTLAGCRVFLLPHQIVTIIRCLETRPVRYMLADEVGLGKTIEACGIIKILEAQNPDLRVLYIVPFALVDQWRSELFYKFNIAASVEGEKGKEQRHVLLSMADLHKKTDLLDSSKSWDVVVVDETHRLLADKSGYDKVKKLSQRTENILLLSATPIQDRQQEYLNLLTLLSPQQYEKMSKTDFEVLVGKQKKIQRKIHSVVDDIHQYRDYAVSIKKRLSQLAQELADPMLQMMVGKLELESEDQGLESAHQVVAYVCEHYRLERRVVRNRREMLRDSMPVRKLIEMPYPASTADQLYDEAGAIDVVLNWLQEHKDDKKNFLVDVAQPILSSLFSSPWALKEMLLSHSVSEKSPVMQAVNEWVRAAEHELKRMNEALDENPDLIRGRLLRALDYLEQETDITNLKKTCKILVFTQFSATLDHLKEMVERRLGKAACVVFRAGMDRETLEANVDAFQSNDECRMMICDELGGEGRNFQMADLLLHLDLPWTANALEQRIGRLDRLGRAADRDVISVVFYAENTLEEHLFTLWNKGMKLFTQSLSGLEIITGEVSDRMIKALEEDIASGLTYALEDILDQTESMREGVEDEQMYDTEAMLYRPLTKVIEQMLSLYQGREDEIFSEAMLSWSTQAGLKPTLAGEGLLEFREDRFSVGAAVNAMIIPPDWTKYERYPLVKRSGRLTGTFNRSLAIQREDVLFHAPGDPIFDAIVENAMTCSRGRASAFTITESSLNFHGILMVWNVEPDVLHLIKEEVNVQYLSQFRAYLPMEQIFTTYPFDEASHEVKPEEVKELIIKERYRVRKAIHWGSRKGYTSGQARIQKFKEIFPPERWQLILHKANSVCRKKALAEVKALSDNESAVAEARRIVQAYCASNLFFGHGTLENEQIKKIYTSVLRALKHPKLSLDSMAFIKAVKSDDVKSDEVTCEAVKSDE